MCFAAWAMIGAFAPQFGQALHLTGTATALLVAVPLLTGAVSRIPMGMLADRFGGRVVFSILMFFVAAVLFALPAAFSYRALVTLGFFLGLAGASFAIGVDYVSHWFSMETQGRALGVYALGNIGQSIAIFGGPVLAAVHGRNLTFRGLSVAVAIWGIVFLLLGRDANNTARRKTLTEIFAVITREPLSWALAAFNFITFGGFISLASYLPTLLRDEFAMRPADAGFRAAAFVVLGTIIRPVGGWLADKLGGARLLGASLALTAGIALLLTSTSPLVFTASVLTCAVLMGLGSSAILQLVPRYFPAERGTVTGLVATVGGLGGFFPPVLLGMLRDRLHVIWPGFVLLAISSAAMWWVNKKLLLNGQGAAEAAVAGRF
jgi:NNP family nitrate/nitrite transporter-like MFS transporter